MKKFETYIVEAVETLDTLFGEIDTNLKELRTTGMFMRYNNEVENEEYYTFIKEAFNKLEKALCSASHALASTKANVLKEDEKHKNDNTPALDFAMMNISEHMKKYTMYNELYTTSKFLKDEADNFFNNKK